MTSHELARLLLAFPEKPLRVMDDSMRFLLSVTALCFDSEQPAVLLMTHIAEPLSLEKREDYKIYNTERE